MGAGGLGRGCSRTVHGRLGALGTLMILCVGLFCWAELDVWVVRWRSEIVKCVLDVETWLVLGRGFLFCLIRHFKRLEEAGEDCGSGME